MWHVWREGRGVTQNWWGKLEGNGLVGKSRLRWAANNVSSRNGMGAWIGLIWLRVGTGGGLL